MVASLLRHAHRIRELETVILFGSSVDGTFDKRSDIDLLMLFDTEGSPERTQMGAVLRVLRDVRKEARVLREVNPVLARSRGGDLDRDFLGNVQRSGVVVWARPTRYLPIAKDPIRQTLIRWNSTALTSAQRARLHRVLFGQSGSKIVNGKRYTWSVAGLAHKNWKYGPGTILVPTPHAGKIVEALRACGARPTMQRFLIPS